MRLAVVYHLPSPGGVTRFTFALMEGLLSIDPNLTIDYYLADKLVLGDHLSRVPSSDRVRMIGINDPEVVDNNLDGPRSRSVVVSGVSGKLLGHPRLHRAARLSYVAIRGAMRIATRRRTGKHWYEFALTPEIASALSAYDVVYFPFPYYMDPVAIAAPMVGTFHDFNQLYFPVNFGGALLRRMDRQLKFWTTRTDAAVVSTRFVEGDLLKHFSGAAGRSSVVFVAPYSLTPISEPDRLAAVERFGLRDQSYLIYPANNAHHKNLLGLITAADIMKRRQGRLEHPIVLTGFGTDGLGTYKWPSFRRVDRFLAHSSLVVGEDVRGLGFVTDQEVDALTRSARIVVSTSLYEAGCGPALDAWQFGVPVAFSNIPPFLEQLSALGVEAWTFDPSDPADIASVLEQALQNRDEALAMAARSKKAIVGYTWERAAQGYMEAFNRAIEHYKATSAQPR